MTVLRSQLFAGDALLQRIADDGPDRISQNQNRRDPAVAKVQTALLDWRPDVLPQFGADGDYGGETAAAVHRFKVEELGVTGPVIDDVGPRTVQRLDEIRLAVEQPVPPVPPTPATGPFVRQDVYALQPAGAPLHPILRAYAGAVAELKRNAGPSPHRWWSHHTQVHGQTPDPADGLRNSCQHFGWYFLPWHRMYLFFFEAICRSIVQTLPDIDDETKQTWALPYWDYDRDDSRNLPPAFRDPFLAGAANPLFDAAREPGVNSPVRFRGEPAPRLAALTPLQTTARGWFNQLPFSTAFAASPGFGGSETGFHHFREPPASNGGPLEATPHGVVHNFVGLTGKMGDFDQAAGDPIFWLHHSNIDRIWEIWRANAGAGQDPTSAAYTGRTFRFLDDQGSQTDLACGNVFDTLNSLNYSYADISVPVSAGVSRRAQLVPRDPDSAPTTIGSIDAPMSISADAPLPAVSVDVENLADIVNLDRGNLPSVLLTVDHIDAPEPPKTMWGVFIQPEGGEAEFVGAMPLFGLIETRKADAEHDLSYTFDVTDIVLDLMDRGLLDPTRVTVSFAPINDLPEGEPDPPVSVGTISLLVQ